MTCLWQLVFRREKTIKGKCIFNHLLELLFNYLLFPTQSIPDLLVWQWGPLLSVRHGRFFSINWKLFNVTSRVLLILNAHVQHSMSETILCNYKNLMIKLVNLKVCQGYMIFPNLLNGYRRKTFWIHCHRLGCPLVILLSFQGHPNCSFQWFDEGWRESSWMRLSLLVCLRTVLNLQMWTSLSWPVMTLGHLNCYDIKHLYLFLILMFRSNPCQ